GYEEAAEESPPHRPTFNATAMSAPIDRPNNYGQAGETYRSFEDWERDDLINNLSDALVICEKSIQDAMIEHFTEADKDYGRRVQEGIEMIIKEIQQLKTENKFPGPEACKTNYSQDSLAALFVIKQAVYKHLQSDPY